MQLILVCLIQTKNDINLVPTLVVRTLDLAKDEIKIDDNAMIGPYK